MATDSSQQVVWRGDSDAFGAKKQDDSEDGEEADDSGKVTVNLRFPGQYFDKETRLHYNWNRYYDPGTGRYISSDPIGLAGGINTYAYVGGNPLRHTDPRGLDAVLPGPIPLPIPLPNTTIPGHPKDDGSYGGLFPPGTMSSSSSSSSSWEDELFFNDHGAKNESSKCTSDSDKDCKSRLIQLKLAYMEIRAAEFLGFNTVAAKDAYMRMAMRYHEECPYWEKVTLFW
jgi:RHS repeat-associated protein